MVKNKLRRRELGNKVLNFQDDDKTRVYFRDITVITEQRPEGNSEPLRRLSV